MKKYIVFGGAGFIGSHMTERLLRDGHKVIVVDDLSSGFEKYLPKDSNLTFLNIDISDWNALSKNAGYFQGAAGVFHFAAKARIQPSIFDPSITHDSNVTGTFNILQIMKMLDIRNIVYSASSSYYGLKANIPSKETDPCDCQTPYSVTKYMGELYCSTWSKVFGINSIRLRYFNVWGPRSPTEGQYAPVVSLFFRQIMTNSPITVVGDGQQRRDFTHVLDVVQANYKAMQYMDENAKLPYASVVDETFNIGTGKNYAILDLANMVRETYYATHALYRGLSKCDIIHVPERIGEAKLSLADNSKAKNILNWEPIHSVESKLEELCLYYTTKEGKF